MIYKERIVLSQRQYGMGILLYTINKYLKRLFRRYKITKSIKERLIEAERERIKMQTLADQNAAAVQKAQNKKEQKKMDEMGVMQFNLQPQN
jgi:flagellar export protein FliJ